MKIFFFILFSSISFLASAQNKRFDSIKVSVPEIKMNISQDNFYKEIKLRCCITDTTKKILFIIDDKMIEDNKAKSVFENISPSVIDSIKIISPAEAVSKYGDNAKYGAVIIKMKK